MKSATAVCNFLFILLLGADTSAQSTKSPRTVLVNPTDLQIKSKPTAVLAKNAYGTIQRAINSQDGPSVIYLSCGVYTENLVITASDIKVRGEERGCVQLQPADPTLPVITLDATNSSSMAY